MPEWLTALAGPGGAMILLGVVVWQLTKVANRWVDSQIAAFAALREDFQSHARDDASQHQRTRELVADVNDELLKQRRAPRSLSPPGLPALKGPAE